MTVYLGKCADNARESFLEELTLLNVTLLEQLVQIAECVDLYLIKEWTL